MTWWSAERIAASGRRSSPATRNGTFAVGRVDGRRVVAFIACDALAVELQRPTRLPPGRHGDFLRRVSRAADPRAWLEEGFLPTDNTVERDLLTERVPKRDV